MKSTVTGFVVITQMVLVSYVLSQVTNKFEVAVFNKDVVADGCPYVESCSFKNLSCRYLAHLSKHSVSQKSYADLKSAKVAVQRSEVSGALYMNENFTDTFVAKMALGEDADEETINTAKIQVWLESEQDQTNDSLKQLLQSAFNDFIEDIQITCNIDSKYYNFQDPFFYNSIDAATERQDVSQLFEPLQAVSSTTVAYRLNTV